MSSYPPAGQPQPSYGSEPAAGQQGEPPAYPSQGYPDQAGQPQVAYPQRSSYPSPQSGAYPQGSYAPPTQVGNPAQADYPQSGYPQPAYPQAGSAQSGYAQQGYPQAGYPAEGYAQQQAAAAAQAGYAASAGYPYPGYGTAGYPYPGQGAGADDPLVATQVGDWWKKVVGVLGRSWRTLLLIELALYVPVLVLLIIYVVLISALTAGSVSSGDGPGAGLILLMIFGQLLVLLLLVGAVYLGQGASIYTVARQAANQPVTVAQALSFAKGRVLPLLGWGVLASIAASVASFFFVLPGVYLQVVFTSALSGVIIFERGNIGRTFDLAHKDFWTTLGRLLTFELAVVAYVLAIYGIIVATGAGVANSSQPSAGGIVVTVIAMIIGGILMLAVPFGYVAASVVSYASLRNKENPAVGTHVLVAELDRS